MQEEPNPAKDLVFDYVNSSESIPRLISEKKFDKAIDEIIENCYEEILSMGEEDEAVGVFATGILHYMLTSALIASQRKIEFQGVGLDIVVPDVKTLELDQKRTLLICIPGSSDVRIVKERISQLEKVQTTKENIWLVLSKDIPTGKKSFVLSKKDNTFSRIIFEIARFSNVRGANRFKILRV